MIRRIRRALLVAAASAALVLPATVLSATAALAYFPAGHSFSLADPKPSAAVPFKVHAAGAKAYDAVTLTVTRKPERVGAPGARSMTRLADARGVVDFDVSLTEDGIWTLQSAGTDGAVLSRQSVTVAEKGTIIIAGESAGGAAGGAEAEAGGAEAGDDEAGAGDAEGATGGDQAGRAEAGAGDAEGAAGGDQAGGAEGGAGDAEGAAGGDQAGGAEAAGPVAGGRLGDTGIQGLSMAVGGGVLVLVGAGLVFVVRRRNPAPGDRQESGGQENDLTHQ